MSQNRTLSPKARLGRAQPGYPPRACAGCGALFSPFHLKSSRWCSLRCKKRALRVTPPKPRPCAVCGALYAPKYEKKSARYCGAACKSQADRARVRANRARHDKRRAYARTYSKGARYRDQQRDARSRIRSVKRAGRVTHEEWQKIVARFGGRCAYCRREAPLEMDHVVALSKGGRHEAANVVPACRPCNAGKGDRDWSAKLNAD